jgi:hypothetical protein
LEDYFGLILTESGTSATWEGNRLLNLLEAVRQIVERIAATLYEDNIAFGAILFRESFGGVTFQLTGGYFSEENQEALASTSPGGDIIYLYMGPLRSGETHSAENIIHELGHSVAFRTSMYAEWEPIRVRFSREIPIIVNEVATTVISTLEGFGVTEGWREEYQSLRQNTYDYTQFAACRNLSHESICQEVEEERLADMFLAWVSVGDPFDNSERGIAMRSFVEGSRYTRQRLDVDLLGMAEWIKRVRRLDI